MLRPSFTTKGWCEVQLAAAPPSQTDTSLALSNQSPVLEWQARTGFVWLPLRGQAQLGLQQSQ
jgi:hypothetical protein